MFIYITAQILRKCHFSFLLLRQGPPFSSFNFNFIFSVCFVQSSAVVELYMKDLKKRKEKITANPHFPISIIGK